LKGSAGSVFLKNSVSLYKYSKFEKETRFHFRNSPLKQIDFKGASGMIKFLDGSCLSGLGIVLKEP
jgi:hypothetical protein